RYVGFHDPLSTRRRSDAIILETRLVVVRQQPRPIGSGGSSRGMSDRLQPMIRGQLEDLHSAELPLPGLASHIDDEVAIPDPSATATPEAHIVELAESLLLFGGFVQRRPEHLAQQQLATDQDKASNSSRTRNALRRHTRRANHNELAPSCQRPHSEQ